MWSSQPLQASCSFERQPHPSLGRAEAQSGIASPPAAIPLDGREPIKEKLGQILKVNKTEGATAVGLAWVSLLDAFQEALMSNECHGIARQFETSPRPVPPPTDTQQLY